LVEEIVSVVARASLELGMIDHLSRRSAPQRLTKLVEKNGKPKR
jgi:hypothetical protein